MAVYQVGQAQKDTDGHANRSGVVGFHSADFVLVEPLVHRVAGNLFHATERRVGVEQLHRVRSQFPGIAGNGTIFEMVSWPCVHGAVRGSQSEFFFNLAGHALAEALTALAVPADEEESLPVLVPLSEPFALAGKRSLDQGDAALGAAQVFGQCLLREQVEHSPSHGRHRRRKWNRRIAQLATRQPQEALCPAQQSFFEEAPRLMEIDIGELDFADMEAEMAITMKAVAKMDIG